MDINNQYDKYLTSDLFDSKTVSENEETLMVVLGNYSSKAILQSVFYGWGSKIYWAHDFGFILEPLLAPIESKYVVRNRELLRRFLKHNPEFSGILGNAYNEITTRFNIIGQPIIETESDPEYGGDLSLIVYFKTDNKQLETTSQLFDLRKTVRRNLRDENRLLITFFYM